VITHRESGLLNFFGILAAAFPLALLVLGLPLFAADERSQATDRKTTKSTPASAATGKDARVPFRVGETLNFTIAWASFSSAATVRLIVGERRDLAGTPDWHFQAFAHTENPLRAIFTVDDQFDSYTDTATLFSRQYEIYLSELGRKVDRIVRLQPQGEKAWSSLPAVLVPPGTRDPLGAFYELRTVDWQKNPEFVAPVYDGRDIYEMHAHLSAPADDVTVPAGRFSAERVAITAFQNRKPVSGLQVVVWIARDVKRTPVQIAADLPFASLHAVLTPASP
jgi:hypothetical protein